MKLWYLHLVNELTLTNEQCQLHATQLQLARKLRGLN